jgi:hypothetical protein
MKFASTILSLAALFSVALASAEDVQYNTIYDDPSYSLNGVACSNGPHGLVTAGFNTIGDLLALPGSPSVGGAFAVSGWGSPECGSCWNLEYNGNSIYVIAFDTISSGFDLSLTAMNELTGNNAVALGTVNAIATQVSRSDCGL